MKLWIVKNAIEVVAASSDCGDEAWERAYREVFGRDPSTTNYAREYLQALDNYTLHEGTFTETTK